MKKSFALLFAAGIVCSLAFTSCREKIKTVRGKVASVDYHGDTLVSMKVTADGGEYLFNLDKAQFNNGIMLTGDSLIVNYYKGHGDTLRAAVVTVLPNTGHLLKDEIQKDKPLMTAPANK